jgi:hypothetical protein
MAFKWHFKTLYDFLKGQAAIIAPVLESKKVLQLLHIKIVFKLYLICYLKPCWNSSKDRSHSIPCPWHLGGILKTTFEFLKGLAAIIVPVLVSKKVQKSGFVDFF